MTAEECTVETYFEASSTTGNIRIQDRSLVSLTRTSPQLARTGPPAVVTPWVR